MNDAKRALRTEMRRVRATIADRHHRSDAIWASVLPICRDLANANPTPGPLRVLAFVGTGGEPDTGGLIEELTASGCSVLLPRVEGEEMVAVGFVPGHDLVRGAFGIFEPLGPAVQPRMIDVVIVPGLAFTTDGHRLGQGGGFYDRYLPLLRPDCVTIGVCFREQIVETVPGEAHDRIVGNVITDAVQE